MAIPGVELTKGASLKTSKNILPLFLGLTLVAMPGCNYSRDKVSTQPIDGNEQWFAKISRTIFQPKCMNCHSGPKPSADVDLSSFESIENSKIVVPGDFPASRLYKCIAVEVGKKRMPKGGDKLPDEDIASIKNWIEAGAPFEYPKVEPPPPPEPVPSPDYEWLRANVFGPKCLMCHSPQANGDDPSGDFDLTDFKTLMAGKDKRIIPGDPKASLLLQRVQADEMPAEGDPLSELEKKMTTASR